MEKVFPRLNDVVPHMNNFFYTFCSFCLNHGTVFIIVIKLKLKYMIQYKKDNRVLKKVMHTICCVTPQLQQ